ncbi:MAG TPA: CpsD/CapB family tyrosine-protein kinase [Vicinamibacterales bacterium]|nr:CpsD/CapB family tyrosine-protein kinase [Vicinamibacterales bacterium]
MSRIQDILNKAEREGGVRRTRALGRESAGAPAAVAAAPTLPRPPAEPAGGETRTAALGLPAAWQPAMTETAPTRDAALDRRLVAALAPQSLAAEQYRSVRTRIHQAEHGRPLRSIIVTSPSKGDGKSLSAANLALTMAQEFQQRVLLLDADLRRSTMHRLFGIEQTPGLADVLMGAATLEDVLIPLPAHALTIVPAGLPPTHPAELLGSASMRRVLDTLRTRFDRVILDMPPVAPLADVQIVSAMADALLLIVRAGVTAKPAIERALAGLDTSKVLGLVLNEAGGDGQNYDYEGYGYIAG